LCLKTGESEVSALSSGSIDIPMCSYKHFPKVY
jgi:hypothetical protein